MVVPKTRKVVRCERSGDRAGDYRWLLEVALLGSESGGRLVVIQMNPSMASDSRSDPTVGKVESWARRHGFSSVVFLNLFAMRTPIQAELLGLAANDYSTAVGGENDAWITAATQNDGTVVAAWGKPDPALERWTLRRQTEVTALLGAGRVHRVGTLTQGRWPRHGRGWNGDVELRYWSLASTGV